MLTKSRAHHEAMHYVDLCRQGGLAFALDLAKLVDSSVAPHDVDTSYHEIEGWLVASGKKYWSLVSDTDADESKSLAVVWLLKLIDLLVSSQLLIHPQLQLVLDQIDITKDDLQEEAFRHHEQHSLDHIDIQQSK